MHVHLTAAHWVYLAGVILIVVTMVLRKNIVVPAVAATCLTALVYSGSVITALTAIFNASLTAATNLFNIFLIIALVTALLGALQTLGADRRMVTPFRRIMRGGHSAYWVLAVVTYVISLFFWPTPAVPLVGAVLIPVAIRAGLSPMGVGMVVAIAGQGMALSSDYVIRVAPGLSAKAAGADAGAVADRALVLSLIVGVVALVIAYVQERRRLRTPSEALLSEWAGGKPEIVERPAPGEVAEESVPAGVSAASQAASAEGPPVGHGAALRGTGYAEPTKNGGGSTRWATVFAVAVPAAYLALIVYMILAKALPSVPDLNGSDAAALVGGVAAVLLFLAALAHDRSKFLETSASHVVDGLVFAFRAMGVVLPIAGFFFIGNSEFAGTILGTDKAPSLLYDLVQAGQQHLPHSAIVTAFGILVIGMIAGLEGSGFSGLPLTGSLAGGLAPAIGMAPATLAAVGQMGNIWSGGGTLVAWSSLVAVAGFARVPVVELARRCFVPVAVGLVLATAFAVVFF